MRTVVVLGAAYGGCQGARILAQSLPAGWRLVVIDRNTHMNHVYVFPRFTVHANHAPKGFIPYKYRLFPQAGRGSTSHDLLTPPQSPSSSVASLDDSPERHEFIQGYITSLTAHSVTFVRPPSLSAPTSRRGSSGQLQIDSNTCVGPSCQPQSYGTVPGQQETIEFDYVIYALGSGMPDPVNVWSEHVNVPESAVTHHEDHHHGLEMGSKRYGVQWMQQKAEQLRKAQRIIVVGAGALGIEFATDLKDTYPDKQITLLHSRTRMMPIYPIEVHNAVVAQCKKLGIELVLGERVMTWPDEPEHLDGTTKVITTDKGRKFEADLVLPCTGQKPHVALIAALEPSLISPVNSRIRVLPTMQVHTGPVHSSKPRTPEAQFASLSLGAAPPTPPSSDNGSSHVEDHADHAAQDFSHIFAAGDCADAGAIQAGHTAYYQSEVAARNILRLIEKQEGRKAEPLEAYKSGAPAIKVTLGMKAAVTANAEGVKVSEEGVDDLQVMVMWPSFDETSGDMNEYVNQ